MKVLKKEEKKHFFFDSEKTFTLWYYLYKVVLHSKECHKSGSRFIYARLNFFALFTTSSFVTSSNLFSSFLIHFHSK